MPWGRECLALTAVLVQAGSYAEPLPPIKCSSARPGSGNLLGGCCFKCPVDLERLLSSALCCSGYFDRLKRCLLRGILALD